MKKTIVTLTSKDYIVGTYVLLYSLLKNGGLDNFNFHVLIEDGAVDVTEFSQTLGRIANSMGKMDKIGFTVEVIKFNQFGQNTLPFYKNALAKFSIFKLKHKEFLFMDSDMLVLNDISELFKLEADFSACVDMGTPNEFNTGLMYIKKKWLGESIYRSLIDSSRNEFSYRGDQEHINTLVGNYNRLPNSYNTLKDQYRHLGSWIFGVKILHYISKKPWTPYHPILHKSGNLEFLQIEKLWNSYFEELKEKTNIDYTFFKDRTDLIKYVAESYPNGYGVEVGVQEGVFSKTILENWDCETLYLVDPWEEHEEYKNDVGAVSQTEHNKNLEATLANVQDHKDRAEIIRDYSVNASEEFEDDSLDFVYLDARHDKEGIREDIEVWWPKMAKGGILAGHDYTDLKWNSNHIEVKSVVDEFFPEVNYTLDGPYPSWWIKKL